MDKRLKIDTKYFGWNIPIALYERLIDCKQARLCRSLTHFIEMAVTEKVKKLENEGLLEKKIVFKR